MYTERTFDPIPERSRTLTLFRTEAWQWRRPDLLTEDYMKNLAQELNSVQEKGRAVSNRLGWQSPSYRSKDLPWQRPLIEFLTKELEPVYRELKITHSPTLSEYWINFNPPAGFNWAHNHPNARVSTVFYVQATENCGELVFESPYTELHSPNEYALKPEQGMILAWPAYVRHRVEPNTSEQARVSIAMNWL